MLHPTRNRVSLSFSLVLIVLGTGWAQGPRSTHEALHRRIDRGLHDAIDRGVDLYNGGDQEGCRRLFEGALRAMRPLLDHRPDLQKAIEKGLADAERQSSPRDRAFTLRGVIDRVREAIKSPRSEKSEPGKKEAPLDRVELSAREEAILERTNQEREKKGLKPLRPNALLFQAARAHSANMAKQDTLAHELDGKGPGDRLRDIGYENASWAENCAWGQKTAEEVVSTWMDSKGHRENILNERLTEIGIGVAATNKGILYYTQVFGRPRGR